MKFNRNLSYSLLGTMVLSLLTIGCKDDFTEEDLLNKNIELAEQ